MSFKVGINGFGRIGRLSLRAILEHYGKEIQVVAINDLADTHTSAHLFTYDSTFRKFHGDVKATDNELIINGSTVHMSAERDPAKIDWNAHGVQLVLECTGLFTKREAAEKHLGGSVKKVLISAPATDEDITIVMGVNDKLYKPSEHHIISNASCTTNSLAPVAKVLHENFTIEKGLMTTVHAYTNDQNVQDQFHKDLRRARAAAVNIIPTSTGAAKAISLVLPDLKGKLDGFALRVPTITGSVTDLTVKLSKKTTVEEVNSLMKQAAHGVMRGVLEYSELPLVSGDIIANPHSAIFDAGMTKVMDGDCVKILSWYDNEWGYSNRVADLIHTIALKGV